MKNLGKKWKKKKKEKKGKNARMMQSLRGCCSHACCGSYVDRWQVTSGLFSLSHSRSARLFSRFRSVACVHVQAEHSGWKQHNKTTELTRQTSATAFHNLCLDHHEISAPPLGWDWSADPHDQLKRHGRFRQDQLFARRNSARLPQLGSRICCSVLGSAPFSARLSLACARKSRTQHCRTHSL